MADQVQFELVSPERLLVSRPVEMVVVPGVEGDFGVLPGHAPLISEVRPGVISVFEGGKVEERIFVAGGFAEVTAERCTVLAEQALPIAEIDRGAVEADLRRRARTWPGRQERSGAGGAEGPSPSPRPRSRPSRRRSTEAAIAAPRRPILGRRNAQSFRRPNGRRHG
jgi:F-type H+-transporting ATPase subunit epsilon